MATSPSSSSAEAKFEKLLIDAKGGCAQALGILLDDARTILHRFVKRRLPLELQAKNSPSDLVQDCLLKAHQSFAEFRGTSKEDLFAWLRQILLRHFGNVFRAYCEHQKRNLAREVPLDDPVSAESRRLRESLTDDGLTPPQALDRRERDLMVSLAMEQLPEQSRLVLRLRAMRHSYPEIAQMLGCSPEAARKLFHRALHKFGALVKRSGISPNA